ncbi:MAG TPA: hypothetical protein VE287_13250, partial [Actinopolymorphaceae bacterium]|nr:hypothetical protein [Actinopolymorphaceae bacterium]
MRANASPSRVRQELAMIRSLHRYALVGTVVVAALVAGPVTVSAAKAPEAPVAPVAPATSTASTTSSFTPGQPWLDDNGATIQAHGGQVVVSKDASGATLYYWYGEDRSNGYYNSPGVHVYTSHDLYNWTDAGLALRSMQSPDQFTTVPYFSALYSGYSDTQRAAV